MSIARIRRHDETWQWWLGWVLHRLWRLLLYALLILIGTMLTTPFLWLVSTSLKRHGEGFMVPIRWLPEKPHWENYVNVFIRFPYARFIYNTVIITVLATLGNVISSVLVGYSLARLRWSGRNVVFVVLLATMMLPGVVTLVPQFIIFFKIGWINNYLPLIVPAWFGSAFYIFLLRQFMRALPMELDEAARVDGAGSFRILWRIIAPLCMPAIATVTIFAAMSHYNDFMHPLLYLSKTETYTISLGLRMFQTQHVAWWELQMAAATVAVLPLVIIFFFNQKAFIKGIAFTGLSGR
jgi:multiple sugar transport system permease protein